MKNTQLNTVPAVISPDQVSSLVDLVNDQIKAQRVYLRTSEFRYNQNIHVRALTHLRNIKKVLTLQDQEARRQERAEVELMDENIELFQMFNV